MPENITWGLIWDLKCTLRFLFSLEWICYCKSQKKNWKNFLNHQLITQIKISLVDQAQAELRAAIFHISCRLRLWPVQPQKLPRSWPLWSFSSPGTEGLPNDLQHDQCNQTPHTHSYIGRSNTTSHLPIFLHCWHYRWNPTWRCFPGPSLQKL